MSRLIILMLVMAVPLSAFGAEPATLKYALSLYADEKGVGLNQPEGIACGDDRLVVADTGNARLVLYSLQGGEVTGGAEIKLPQLPRPVRLAMTSKGDLYALDERQRKVARITRDGVFTGYVEPSGPAAQAMILPSGLGVDAADNLYLLDILGGRVLVLNAEGQVRRQIDFPKEYGFITDLAVDPNGTVFAVDAVTSRVYSNAKEPAALAPITVTLKEDLKFPSNIAADRNGALYISDRNGGGIVVVGQDGAFRKRMLSLGWKEGAVRYPSQTCVDKDGALFVADRANNRIQKFTPLK